MSEFFCSICSLTIRTLGRAVYCNICKNWFRIGNTKFDDHAWRQFDKAATSNLYELNWFCSTCRTVFPLNHFVPVNADFALENTDKAIQCSGCDEWTHMNCANERESIWLSLRDYRVKKYGWKWFCAGCFSLFAVCKDEQTKSNSQVKKLGDELQCSACGNCQSMYPEIAGDVQQLLVIYSKGKSRMKWMCDVCNSLFLTCKEAMETNFDSILRFMSDNCAVSIDKEPEASRCSNSPESLNIDVLPNEVLSMIFVHYVNTEGIKNFLRSVVPVCRKWKELASFYKIWSNVDHLDEETVCMLSRKGYLTHTRTLTLEKNIMLSFRISYNNPKKLLSITQGCPNLRALCLKNYEVVNCFSKAVVNDCPRIESLSLEHVCVKNVYHSCDGLSTNEMHTFFLSLNLKHLELTFISFYGKADLMGDIAKSCPLLEDLVLHMIDNEGRLEFPVAKFQKFCPLLRLLSFRKISFSFDEELVKGFPNLETFIVVGCYSSAESKHSILSVLDKSVKLKKLKFVQNFFLYDDNHTSKDFFKIPSRLLEEFSIKDKEVPFSVLRNVFEKWKHTLRAVKMIEMPMGDAVLPLAYEGSPLEELRIQRSSLSVEVLKEMVFNCSKLRKIDIRGLNLPFNSMFKLSDDGGYLSYDDVSRLRLFLRYMAHIKIVNKREEDCLIIDD